MAKKPLFHQAERVDLPDFSYAVADFPQTLRADLVRKAIGVGVMEGFRIEVLPQSGSTAGHIDIWNGFSFDWGGRLLNDETGGVSQRIPLLTTKTEYWIEIELLFGDSDSDARSFWDPLVDNTDPIPDGQEVTLARVMTRQTPTWRVRQPINNNPALPRGDGGYAPVGFSYNTEKVVPLAVLRTDGSGLILTGDPNTDFFGNDLVSVVTSTGSRTMVMAAGYGEGKTTQGGVPGAISEIYSRKMSDQRPRMFEPLVPPFIYGDTGEVRGSTFPHDGWARDSKSMYDYLATQIKWIKEGSNDEDDTGQFHLGTIDHFDPQLRWVVAKDIYKSDLSGSLQLDPDQILNCTLQITSGTWAGFYAQIRGNETTDGGGYTKIYIGRSSSVPDWLPLPVSNPTLRVVNHRQVNWMDPPTPNSSNRGLNALDDEVVAARDDANGFFGPFGRLKTRLDANKYATATFAPPDPTGFDPVTGAPNDPTHPVADFFQDLNVIRGGFAAVTFPAFSKGGVLYFRRGTYDFATIAPIATVFSMSNVSGFTIEGEGAETTHLYYAPAAPASALTMFALSGCRDITFRNLKITTKGNPFSFIGCENIRFENCQINGEFFDTNSSTIFCDSITEFKFENCRIEGRGKAMLEVTISVDGFNLRDTKFIDTSFNVAELVSVWDIGAVERLYMENCEVGGWCSSDAVSISSLSSGTIKDTNMLLLASGSKFLCGNIDQSVFENVFLAPGQLLLNPAPSMSSAVVSDTSTYGFKVGTLSDCRMEDCYLAGGATTFESQTFLNSYVKDSAFLVGGTTGRGIKVAGTFGGRIKDNDIHFQSGGSVTIGVEVDGVVFGGKVLGNKITAGSGGVGTGVQINNASVSAVAVDGNEINNAAVGISFTSVSSGRLISVQKNIIRGGSVYGIFGVFDTSLQTADIVSNWVVDHSGIGCALFMTGCNGVHVSIEGNDFVAETRGIEIVSSNGGSLVDSNVSNNTCVSSKFSPIAIGTKDSGTIPNIPASPTPSLALLRTNIFDNRCTVTTDVNGGIFLPTGSFCGIYDNRIEGKISSYGMLINGDFTDGTVTDNWIKTDYGTGGDGLVLLGDVQRVSIVDNSCFVLGNNEHGIYIIHPNAPALPYPENVSIHGNHCESFAPVPATGTASGIYFKNGRYSQINDNFTKNFRVGLFLQGNVECQCSGNQLVACSAEKIDLVGANDVKGSQLSIAFLYGVPPQLSINPADWPGDGQNNCTVQASNSGH